MAIIRVVNRLGDDSPLLGERQFGINLDPSSNDFGRVYIGTGLANLPLAFLQDGYTPLNDVIPPASNLNPKFVGTVYTDTNTNRVYICTDNTSNTNVWLDITDASNIFLDNTNTGLVSNNVLGAFEEIFSNGLIKASVLPSYVDDVIEVATYADLPVSGETQKIYVVVNDENSNGDTSTYRWTGTIYAMVSNTLNAQDVVDLYDSVTPSNLTILTTTTTNHISDISNPHSVTKDQVGLGNVDNTSDLDKPISTATELSLATKQNILTEGAFVDGDKSKLDGIEVGATADQTGSEIKIAYEGEPNTNAYDDASKGKVDYLTVTAPTDLDTIRANITNLDNAVGTTGTIKRYDKILSVLDVLALDYTSGNLDFVRYSGDNNTTVYYRDVMTYDGNNNLVTIKHFFGTADLVTATATTTLTYDGSDNLITVTYTEV